MGHRSPRRTEIDSKKKKKKKKNGTAHTGLKLSYKEVKPDDSSQNTTRVSGNGTKSIRECKVVSI